MKLFSSADDIQMWSMAQKSKGYLIGFVPTMGFLHEGHLSLIDEAKKVADKIVVSIFVNPAQFGPGEDYEKYPRNMERDVKLCMERGVDGIYLPEVKKMYGHNYQTYVNVTALTKNLCGAGRPGHFKGVTTVVAKLFNAVQPNYAIFGQKDAQQARVIERMTEDLQYGIKIVVSPIVRENDGLAMSSRNVRLTEEHREQAPYLYKGLLKAEELFKAGERKSAKITGAVKEVLAEKTSDGVIEYVEMVDWKNLKPVDVPRRTALLAIAVKFGDVRLIDNILLEQ